MAFVSRQKPLSKICHLGTTLGIASATLGAFALLYEEGLLERAETQET